MKSPKSLERLRDRVEQATHEILRLREENAGLAQRLQDLEAQQASQPAGTVVALEGDPAALRHQVEGFITAIDRYLSHEDQGVEQDAGAAVDQT